MHNSILDYFPLKREPRPGQIKVLDFIERMVSDGVTDIVIQGPTGCGKSAIGAACCYWAANWPPQTLEAGGIAKPGGYYLVTQKHLQQQIAADVRPPKGQPSLYKFSDFSCLWSAASYPCDGGKRNPFSNESVDEGLHPDHSCQMGFLSKKAACDGRKNKTCPYMVERARFDSAIFSLTNYPFFMTERVYVGALAKRNIMVLDECHTIEKQLLKFGEVEISDKLLKDWGLRGIGVPEIDDMQTFAKWLENTYLPHITDQLETFTDAAKTAEGGFEAQLSKRITALNNQKQRVHACVCGVHNEPDNWVYWCDQTERDGNIVYCKPLNAAPYMDILKSGSVVRVYMSAFTGEKDTFCKSIGLDPDTVARYRLPAVFPKENRPVIMGLVGSMSRRNQDSTLPPLLRVVDKILAKHHDEKGLIHCHSYELGKKIADHIRSGPHRSRVMFPKNAEEKEEQIKIHRGSPDPTVLVSPSVTEGFDFKGDEGRWQIIAKVPYPYLGDRQVKAKKDQDQEWYDMQAIMAIVQSSGRICRSEDDWGVTYVLDEDFKTLYDRRRSQFPDWFKESIVWP